MSGGQWIETLPEQADVVVVGSGGAGLSAALAAAVAGADVVLLEASARWGGTTALSGAQVWVPDNHHMAEVGQRDSFDEALTYCLGQTSGRDRACIEAFLRAGPAMVRFVEAHAPIAFTACDIPDSFADRPGGRSAGRHLEPGAVTLGDLAPADRLVWPAPYPMVLTNAEITDLDLPGGGAFPTELIEQRMAAGEVCMGQGLVVGLLRGCLAAGVRAAGDARVERLSTGPSGVTGVEVRSGGGLHPITARLGVVLANGGFEWDPELVARLQGTPVARPVSPPVNRGDALRLAGAVGAELAHTDESWFWPVATGPASAWSDGNPRPRLMTERGRPHLIWVNSAGRRFVDEAGHNCALALRETDPGTNQPRNQPAWAIGDAQFRRRQPIDGAPRGEPAPDWLVEAHTLDDLAARCGIDPAGLAATVERFDRMAAAGIDDDFGRGASTYDRAIGDGNASHPNLGSIEEPPFFALRVHLGTVGTKGGPRTDASARVLDWNGEPIAGLFAAGNAMASVIGPGTIAPGLTLGQALTWGWIAGTTITAGEPTGSPAPGP